MKNTIPRLVDPQRKIYSVDSPGATITNVRVGDDWLKPSDTKKLDLVVWEPMYGTVLIDDEAGEFRIPASDTYQQVTCDVEVVEKDDVTKSEFVEATEVMLGLKDDLKRMQGEADLEKVKQNNINQQIFESVGSLKNGLGLVADRLDDLEKDSLIIEGDPWDAELPDWVGGYIKVGVHPLFAYCEWRCMCLDTLAARTGLSEHALNMVMLKGGSLKPADWDMVARELRVHSSCFVPEGLGL